MQLRFLHISKGLKNSRQVRGANEGYFSHMRALDSFSGVGAQWVDFFVSHEGSRPVFRRRHSVSVSLDKAVRGITIDQVFYIKSPF